MKKIPKEWLLLIIIAVFVAVIGISEWNKTKVVNRNSGQDTSGVAQRDSPDGGGINTKLEKEEGNVTVVVEYLSDKSTTNNMVFQIALDTHSVNLDTFDFQKEIILEKGGKSFSGKIISQEGSVHHRKAQISFSQTATPFTFVVINLSGIPRREFKFTKFN